MKKRTIGIIGLGHVGAHVGNALILKGLADEIVLVDTNKQKATSERQDLMDLVLNAPHRVNVRVGDYEDMKDCDLIVNCVGKIDLLRNNENRVSELNFNIEQVNDYIPKVMASGFHGPIINISNPCDIITSQIRELSGLPEGYVMGTGTGLDTSRLISALAQKTGIDHHSISAIMLGEHGKAIMFPESAVYYEGKPLKDLKGTDPRFDIDSQGMKKEVHDAAWVTFGGKFCTEYGIAGAACRLVDAILHDTKTIIPVSAHLDGEYGQHDVCAGVPAIIGMNGVEKIVELPLTETEQKEFAECCDSIRENMTKNDQVIRRF